MKHLMLAAATIVGATPSLSMSGGTPPPTPEPPRPRRVSPPVTGRPMGAPRPKGHPGKKAKSPRERATTTAPAEGPPPLYDVQAFHAAQRAAGKKRRKAAKRAR